MLFKLGYSMATSINSNLLLTCSTICEKCVFAIQNAMWNAYKFV